MADQRPTPSSAATKAPASLGAWACGPPRMQGPPAARMRPTPTAPIGVPFDRSTPPSSPGASRGAGGAPASGAPPAAGPVKKSPIEELTSAGATQEIAISLLASVGISRHLLEPDQDAELIERPLAVAMETLKSGPPPSGIILRVQDFKKGKKDKTMMDDAAASDAAQAGLEFLRLDDRSIATAKQASAMRLHRAYGSLRCNKMGFKLFDVHVDKDWKVPIYSCGSKKHDVPAPGQLEYCCTQLGMSVNVICATVSADVEEAHLEMFRAFSLGKTSKKERAEIKSMTALKVIEHLEQSGVQLPPMCYVGDGLPHCHEHVDGCFRLLNNNHGKRPGTYGHCLLQPCHPIDFFELARIATCEIPDDYWRPCHALVQAVGSAKTFRDLERERRFPKNRALRVACVALYGLLDLVADDLINLSADDIYNVADLAIRLASDEKAFLPYGDYGRPSFDMLSADLIWMAHENGCTHDAENLGLEPLLDALRERLEDPRHSVLLYRASRSASRRDVKDERVCAPSPHRLYQFIECATFANFQSLCADLDAAHTSVDIDSLLAQFRPNSPNAGPDGVISTMASDISGSVLLARAASVSLQIYAGDRAAGGRIYSALQDARWQWLSRVITSVVGAEMRAAGFREATCSNSCVVERPCRRISDPIVERHAVGPTFVMTFNVSRPDLLEHRDGISAAVSAHYCLRTLVDWVWGCPGALMLWYVTSRSGFHLSGVNKAPHNFFADAVESGGRADKLEDLHLCISEWSHGRPLRQLCSTRSRVRFVLLYVGERVEDAVARVPGLLQDSLPGQVITPVLSSAVPMPWP